MSKLVSYYSDSFPEQKLQLLQHSQLFQVLIIFYLLYYSLYCKINKGAVFMTEKYCVDKINSAGGLVL